MFSLRRHALKIIDR